MNTISKQEMMDLIERGVMAILDMRRQFELHGICTTEEFDKEYERAFQENFPKVQKKTKGDYARETLVRMLLDKLGIGD